MMSLWDALRMNMMISYQELVRTFLKQSREAQSAIMTDEIPLDDALLQLREFIDENSGEFFVQVWGNGANWICPYISRHLLSLNPLLACCRRYSRGER